MKLSRRYVLAGSAAVAFIPRKAAAWFPHGVGIPKGWNTLPLGAGGLVTGFDIAPDGTMVCRTDVGNCYRWSGTTANITDGSQRWIPLMTYTSLGAGSKLGESNGAYELVIAPNKTTNLYVIYPDISGLAKWWVYYSTNNGVTWTQSNLSMLNADSNSTTLKKSASGKIAVDPNNSDVVYCGMPTGSGNSYGIFRAIDGITFNAITSIADTSVSPGVAGICFDSGYGTITVGGQLRTKRIIIPVGGVGIYESLDGGQTFNETAVATVGTSTLAVFSGIMDYDGVYYCILNKNTSAGYIWRYSGAGGTWVQLDSLSGWTTHQSAGWITNTGILVVDPRNGHQGFVSASGPNGGGVGYTTTNATDANPTWGGATGGEVVTLVAASYEPQWFNYLSQGANAFIGGVARIDLNGTCWWAGTRAFWHFDSIPNFAVSTATTSHSVGRGMEATVAQDICCPPGAFNPVMAAQDVGVMTGGTYINFPTNNYMNTSNIDSIRGLPSARPDAQCLDYAASDSAFMVCRNNVDAGGNGSITSGSGDLSGYSNNYGQTWTPYATSANLLYSAAVTGDISDGSGGSGTVLNVTAVASGTVLTGQSVYLGGTYKGQITALGSGTGGTGTYTIDTASLTASNSLTCIGNIQGGSCVAVDHDHHVCVPAGTGQVYGFIPAYTANATNLGSVTWNFCTGLPKLSWCGRSYVVGQTPRPFAVGFGSDLGKVYAVEGLSTPGTWTIYESDDSGATFSVHSTIITGTISFHAASIFTVPGYPGELWVTAYFNGATNAGIWHYASGSWTKLSALPGGRVPAYFSLGKPDPGGSGYPTLFCMGWAAGASTNLWASVLYYSTDKGVTWNPLGPTGTWADLPISCQIAGLQSIRGDWNVFKRLLVCSAQSGFAFYNS